MTTRPAPADLGTEIARIAAADRLLVALDFDGTLAPLHDEPMRARMLPVARAAVSALATADATAVALVSGRSLVDLRVIAEHDDDAPFHLAGSHGAEFWVPGTGLLEPEEDPVDAALRDRLRAHAEEATRGLAGVWIEPKTFGFAVHTRMSDAATAAAANDAVDRLVDAEAPHWRRRSGRNVVEYAFRHEGKDTAVARLRERLGATAVLFAGDDVTDEDALASLAPGDLGVHVGDRDSAARVSVADIAALAALLARVAQLRGPQRE